MKNFKSFYIVVTPLYTFGKSLHRSEAIKNAESKENRPMIVYIGVVKASATDAELKNLLNCYRVTDMGDIEAYRDDRLLADTVMIQNLMVGFITENYLGV